MTKEEIENYIDDKKQYGFSIKLKGLSVVDVIKLTDRIVDDFKSRTCESCHYLDKSDGCCLKMYGLLDGVKVSDKLNFGCTDWENKNDS